MVMGLSSSLSSSEIDYEKIDVNPPKGTRDFPPEEMRLRSWLFNHFREVSRLFGFDVVDFPVLESEALFIRKVGEEIRDQLYCFERMVGQYWLYEHMTRGRRREHYQWNMDIIGVHHVTAEAELISSIITFFKRIGLTSSDVGFKISSRKVLEVVLRRYSVPDNQLAAVSVIINKMDKIPLEEMKKERKSVGISEETINELLQVLAIKSLARLEGEIINT